MCNLSFRRQNTQLSKVLKYFWLLSTQILCLDPVSIYHLKMDKEKDFPTQLCINFVENSPCFALCNQILPHRQLVTPCCTNCPNYRKHPFHQHMQSRQHLAIWYIVKNYIVFNDLKERNDIFLQSNWFPQWFPFLKNFFLSPLVATKNRLQWLPE